MNYKNKDLCKIRTISTLLKLEKNKDTWKKEIQKACKFCKQLSKKFKQKNYKVQSIRIVTNAFGEYLNTNSIDEAKQDLEFIKNIIDSISFDNLRIRFAIGEAKTYDEISLLPELILHYGDLCNACVNVPLDNFGILDNNLIKHCAKCVKKISKITPRGEGNFNFTVNFNCKEFIPYFPASFFNAKSSNSYVLGLETPDLLVNVLQNLDFKYSSSKHNKFFKHASINMSEALQYHVDIIRKILDTFKNKDFKFVGLDSSAAPSKDCSSMVKVYKLLGVKHFGNSGSLEVSSLLTKVFKSIKDIPLVGFSGLMLAVIEDKGLAKDASHNKYDIRTLLNNSAVCGIGLDTVPIAGNTSVKKISSLMRETGTLAFRLDKPLSVRLFPYPNLKAGQMTKYESDDLCNCKILAVP